MSDAPEPSKTLGWISLALLVLAGVAVAIPLTFFVLTASDKGVALGDGPVEVHASGDSTWGVYVDDRDNSGYSESCSATDSDGRPLALRPPGATLSASETEMLDHVLTTPTDGRFTISCEVRGAEVRVGPVPDLPSLLLGLAAGGLLGLAGLAVGVAWLVRRAAQP